MPGIIITLILVAGTAVSWWLLRPSPPVPTGNLAVLAAQTIPELEPALQTDQPKEAEVFIYNHFGWRVETPRIREATLRGVGFGAITSGIQVPAFIYSTTTDSPLVVFVWNYAFLDRYQKQELSMAPTVLTSLEQSNTFTVEEGPNEEDIVIWRSRDDIFLAISSEKPKPSFPGLILRMQWHSSRNIQLPDCHYALVLWQARSVRFYLVRLSVHSVTVTRRSYGYDSHRCLVESDVPSSNNRPAA